MNQQSQDQSNSENESSLREPVEGGERSESPATDKKRAEEKLTLTEGTSRQRMDDDGGRISQPRLSDLKPRFPQPDAALPAPHRAEPQSSPHFGDQEREDPRRLRVDDAPSSESEETP